MTYGLKVTGTGGIFQIDSDLSEAVQLAIRTSGAVAAGGQVTGIKAGEVLIASVTQTQFNNQTATADKGKLEVNFTNGSNGTTVATFRYPATYAILSTSNSTAAAAAAEAAGDYGVQVLNAGAKICFDSRSLSQGYNVTQIFGSNSRAGGRDYSSSNKLADGTISNLYVVMNGSSYFSSGTSVDQVFDGFTFDYSTSPNRLYHRGYFFVPANIITGAAAYYNLSNISEVIIGQLLGGT